MVFIFRSNSTWFLNCYIVSLDNNFLHSSEFSVDSFVVAMGKGKFRLNVKKNERKRKKSRLKKKPLVVKVPLKFVKPVEPESTEPMKVSLPIAAYTASNAYNLDVLGSRLRKCLSPEWAIADNINFSSTTTSSLFLYKLSSLATGLVFSMVINCDFSWELRIGNSPIPQGFQDSSLFVRSVDQVTKILDYVDHATFCFGNDDTKFSQLVTSHKGCFKNASGKLFTHVMINVSCILLSNYR